MVQKIYHSLQAFEENTQGRGNISEPCHWILVEDGAVLDQGTGQAPEIPGAESSDGSQLYLVPGFTDIHNHGGGGIAFDDAQQLEKALEVHGQAGTGQLIASLVTNPLEDLAETVGQLAHYISSQEAGSTQPRLAGIHLEGPYLSPLHKGAHNPNFLLAPVPEQAAELIEAADGHLKQITIAPETDRDLETIRYFVDRGVRVAVGHTDAGYEQAKAAFDAGASILTHTFNAMRPLLHRAPGPIAAALDSEHVTLELIVDGVHVHPPVVRSLFAMAPGRVALITDAMAAAGCADGHYMLGSLEVNVENAIARLKEGGAIAGSTLTLGRAVRQALSYGLEMRTALEAATLVPQRALGLGTPDKLLILDGQGEIIENLC